MGKKRNSRNHPDEASPPNTINTRPLIAVSLSTTALIALLSLVGWGTNNPYLRAFIPNAVPMNPVTAICFLLLTIAIALMNRPNKGERWLGQYTPSHSS